MSYRHAVYVPLKPLAHEHRTVRSGNYLVFYWVEEQRKAVVIARVAYGKVMGYSPADGRTQHPG